MNSARASQNGDYIDIGTATTEGYSGTFGISWTPTAEGIYQIVASFEGDTSYGSSSATTWVTVGPATSASKTFEPEPETPETTSQPEQPTPEEPTAEEPTPEEPTPEQPEQETTVEAPLISTELAIIIAIITACIIGVISFVALKLRK